MSVCEGVRGLGVWGWECGDGSVGVGGEAGRKRGWKNVEVSEQTNWLLMALPTLLCEAASSCFSSLISSCALFKSSCNIEHRCSKLSDFSTAAFLAADIDSSFARISETRS